MDRLNRYVFSQLFIGMVLVATGLTSVVWLSQSLRYVEMIVNRGLSAGMFVYLTLLLLPNFLAIILPIAVFSVVVFVYNKLIADRELVVMRAAGLSQMSLAKPAILLSMAAVVFGYALNLYLMPESYRLFRELQWEIRYNYSQILLKEGEFTNVSTGITVYVRERSKDGQLLGILVHDERNPEKPVTLMAEKGAMIRVENGARVLMNNGNRQMTENGGRNFTILYFDRYVFDINSSSEAAPVRNRGPRERLFTELINIDQDKKVQPNDRGKFIVEAHKRLISPFFILGYSLIGLACLLTGSFSRKSQVSRITTAVVIMVLLQLETLGLENLVAKSLNFIPLLYVNGIFPIILATVYLIKNPSRLWTVSGENDQLKPA